MVDQRKMSKPCWFCDYHNDQIADDHIGDFSCGRCGTQNSVYPNINEAEEPSDKTTESEWLNDPFNLVDNEPQTEEENSMANLGDLRKNLVKEDAQTGDVILFVDAGEIKDVDFSKTQDGSDVKTVFQVMVELPDGKNKIYTPNATTRGILSEVWGEDTSAWVNKKAIVKFVDQLSFGKLTKVMILEPTE